MNHQLKAMGLGESAKAPNRPSPLEQPCKIAIGEDALDEVVARRAIAHTLLVLDGKVRKGGDEFAGEDSARDPADAAAVVVKRNPIDSAAWRILLEHEAAEV